MFGIIGLLAERLTIFNGFFVESMCHYNSKEKPIILLLSVLELAKLLVNACNQR
jgi:hypothetical protein